MESNAAVSSSRIADIDRLDKLATETIASIMKRY